MGAYRCSICSIDWPQLQRYKKCPLCGEETSRVWNASAITKAQAAEYESEAKRERFNRYYAAREARRRARGEPTPEERDSEYWRQMEEALGPGA